MSDPDISPLPICEKCRRERPCVRVLTAHGERTICVADCFRDWEIMRSDLKRRVGQMLADSDRDFFDEPTRPDIPVLVPILDEDTKS